jgi:hypothetical protein
LLKECPKVQAACAAMPGGFFIENWHLPSVFIGFIAIYFVVFLVV